MDGEGGRAKAASIWKARPSTWYLTKTANSTARCPKVARNGTKPRRQFSGSPGYSPRVFGACPRPRLGLGYEPAVGRGSHGDQTLDFRPHQASPLSSSFRG